MDALKSSPKDAQVMAAILKDMNIADFESRVINHMLEFTYRYVTDMLDDAKLYASHAGKKNIDVEDVKLSIQCKLDHSFTTPPPKDLLMDIAKHKNNNALPMIKPFTGPKLPPDRYCLSAPNYRLRSLKKPRPQTQAGTSVLQTAPRIVSQTATGTKVPIQVIPKVTSQVVTVRPSLQAATTPSSTPVSAPLIRINTVPGKQPIMGSDLISGTKRKREDDDYDT